MKRRTVIQPIAILSLAAALFAQEPTKLLPPNYQNIFENDVVRVIRVRYEPHQKLPLHDHSPFPTIYVYLTDSGPVRFSHVEEHPFAITRQPLKREISASAQAGLRNIKWRISAGFPASFSASN